MRRLVLAIASGEQQVRIAALDLEVTLDAGERIHTESSYKFNDADVAGLAAAQRI